jgi:hypothetical protein
MDDNTADISAPVPAGEDTVPESHPTAATLVEATPESTETVTVQATTESAQSLALPTKGSSPRKIEANREDARKSTGPKTSMGKTRNSWNSRWHGLLSKRLPLIYGHTKRHFNRLLASLRSDLEPVGTVEEVLVEKSPKNIGGSAWLRGTKQKPYPDRALFIGRRFLPSCGIR